MDHYVRPISSERDVDPIVRVKRAQDERERREREQQERREREQPKPAAPAAAEAAPQPDGPVEGDDGHLHIDIRA